jgi:acyl-CoA synthetase (AMP-forming)/AMP-acid ligase II
MRLPLANHVATTIVLAQRGLLRPVRPDRLVQMVLAYRRFGASLASAYAVNAIARGDQAALVDDQRTLTYRDVDLRTNALANELARRGLGAHDRLGILCRNGSAFVESVVAAGKLGADVVPLNTSFAAPELKAVLMREQPPLLIHDAEFAGIVDEAGLDAIERVVTESELENLIERGSERPPPGPDEEGRTVILTSGTTGTPKGARLARPSGIEPLALLLRIVPIQAGSAYLIPAPLFHAHGYGQMVLASSLGCTIVLPRRFEAERTLALIERHRVESLAAVPVMLKRIAALPPESFREFDTSSLKAVVCSGSSLDPRLARALMAELGPVIYNLYGSTEMAWATIATPDDLLSAPGTVGRPPPQTRVVVLGDDDRPLPPGETGRIYVGHEMLFEGYTDDSLGRDRIGGMMTAGDLGHLDSEGRLFVDAREDDMIISGGENLYPSEIEEALRDHPDVTDIAVIGAEDADFGQRPIAFVVAREGSDLTPEDVDRYARQNLSRFKVPRDVVLLDDLPRNALGKVLRRELRPPTDEGRRRKVG